MVSVACALALLSRARCACRVWAGKSRVDEEEKGKKMGRQRDHRAAAALAKALTDAWDAAGGDAAAGQDLVNGITDRMRQEQENNGQ